MENPQYDFIVRIISDVKPNISEAELEHKLSKATSNLDEIIHKKFGKGANILSYNLCHHETTILLSFIIQYSGTEQLRAIVSQARK